MLRLAILRTALRVTLIFFRGNSALLVTLKYKHTLCTEETEKFVSLFPFQPVINIRGFRKKKKLKAIRHLYSNIYNHITCSSNRFKYIFKTVVKTFLSSETQFIQFINADCCSSTLTKNTSESASDMWHSMCFLWQ